MGTFYSYDSYFYYVASPSIYDRLTTEKKEQKRVMYTSGKIMVASLAIFYVSLLIYMYSGGDGK